MKTNRSLLFPGKKIPLSIKAMGLPLAASLLFATSVVGQLVAPPQTENVVPATKEEAVSRKVMTDLTNHEEAPLTVAPQKSIADAGTETVHLVPFVIVGAKGSNLRESQLRTKKAFAADVLKQYDHSAFSMFQHREDVRLENMTTLKNYADSLLLVGDVKGSREIKKESNRLFLRSRDPESEYIDSLINSRIL